MPVRDDEHAREQFLSEASDLIEGLSRDLLALEQSHAAGRPSNEALNDLFRGVHTLKGLCGMFGLEPMARLAHVLEDLLEDLRLGRLELGTSGIDLLFDGLDGFQRQLSSARTRQVDAQVDIDAFSTRVGDLSTNAREPRNVLEEYDFDQNVLAVLTEYEEHRLRANLERGLTLYRLKIRVPLDAIDTTLSALKERTRSLAEVIAYLPSMEPDLRDAIDLELLLATTASELELRAVLGDAKGTLIPIVRKSEVSLVPAAGDGGKLERSEKSHERSVSREAGDVLSLRSLTSVVRVDIRKLDHLMNVVGDLSMVRNALGRFFDRLKGRLSDRELWTEAQRISRSFDRSLGEVQEGVLDVRMVPLSHAFDKLAVVVRQLAREQDKRVQLVVRGGDTEIDKLIAEDIADPLMHIARNAIDHGIESRQVRMALGKPDVATVQITATQRGNHVVIEVRDDGRGIDPANVREVAMRRGTLVEHQLADLSPHELVELIFLPGFSTSASVTDVSGRGIGMDVVKTNIQRVGGAVEVQSEVGQGAIFTITLPVTLAIIRALLFAVRGRTLALPLSVVGEVLRLSPGAVRTIDGREVLDLRGTTLPLCRIGALFELKTEDTQLESFVVVAVIGQRRLALLVDSLAGQQDIVVKPLGPSLSKVTGVSGATDLGDGRLVLVLDAAGIVDEVLSGKAVRMLAGAQA